ncbi:hypothetical protein A2714_02970 [Candidatus Woesebacteria bacterium RIFCSPHIGHO2_01_FULL_38_9]|uniref:Uncharacterized protein n=2 Tax=Candidatus Woeseibacteriota TaxID=1752722 RepID=A0A1F7Y0R5_9BACT|nr:MAG: hypothetical protein A2714_02970 [Candidatus Woesebacteria bacterium RIFCSPHIGHO2_01_FULL_38_9]OGM58887.1 MAG: hypothetical protein A3A75_06520 [Candidatus Woesebacteria bacterium RIFCSPLOWO2_01_FULL_39_10]
MIQGDRDRGHGFSMKTSQLAGIISCMEMAALYGTYERQLQMPQVEELKKDLDLDETTRVDKLMETYRSAEGHAGLQFVATPFMLHNLPDDLVGECQQTLYILSLGASVHKSPRATEFVQGFYVGQCKKIADELEIGPSALTLGHLGEAILSGKFDLAPELPNE